MISKITISNYRSCISTEFSPHKNLSTFIGPNGSGKTNIFSAIKILSMLCHKKPKIYTGSRDSLTISKIKTKYNVDNKNIIHTVAFTTTGNENNKDDINILYENWYLYELTKKKKRVMVPSWILFNLRNNSHELIDFIKERFDIDNNIIKILIGLVNNISKIRYHSIHKFINNSNSPIVFEVDESTDKSTENLSFPKRFLYNLYLEYKKNTDVYHNYLEMINNKGLKLIDSIEFKEVIIPSSKYNVLPTGDIKTFENNNKIIIPRIIISGYNLSPNQLSDGTYKTMALLFYLFTDKSPLLMIEEPEIGIHHGLLLSIIDIIKDFSRDKQIFISTHSDIILDNINIDNVFIVKNNKGTVVENIIKNRNSSEIRIIKEYLNNIGNLGEYWRSGELENV